MKKKIVQCVGFENPTTAYRDCAGKNEIFRRRLGRLKKETRETMVEDKLPQTLDEVREAIDGLDKELIELLARRQKLVRQAGRLKPTFRRPLALT